MINRQVGQWFGSNIFRFVGSGGMMGASNYTGQPNEAPSAGAASAVTQYASVVVIDNPVGYWRLDELYGHEAYDVMRNYPATYDNGAVQGQETLLGGDNDGHSVFLDGTNDAVGTVSALVLGNEFTLEGWINASASTSGTCIITAQHVSGGAAVPYSLGLSHTLGGGTSATNLGVGFWDKSLWHEVIYGQPFPLGKTMHVAGTKSATSLGVYINGVFVNTSATTVSVVAASAAKAWFGSRFDTGATADYVDGAMDEVALYTSALTEARLRDHYAVGIGYAKDSYPYRVITDGAIGYYRMSEASGTECSTTVNDPDYWAGTYQNTPTLGVTPIIVGDAATNGVRLDGVNEHITVSQVFDQIETNNQYTVETWVIASSSTPGAALIATAYPGAGDVTFSLTYGGAGSETRLETGFYDGTTWFDCINDYPTPLNKKIHAVGTHTGSNLFVYMNGVEVATSAITGSCAVNGTQDIYIGRRWDGFGTTQYINGVVDETAIYASGLSETQVREHYAAGLGLTSADYGFHVIRDGAIAYWEMNETTGTECSTTVNNPAKAGGLITGSPTLGASTTVTGSDGAYEFNGSTQYVLVSGGAAAVNPTGNITAEIWAYQSTSAQGVVMSKYNFGVDAGWLMIVTAGGSTSFDGRSGAASYITSGKTGPILGEGWSHLVGQRNGETWKMYLNGVLEAQTSSGSTGSLSTTEQPELGRLTQTNDNYFNGRLDQGAVYATAISDAAIAEHYALGIGYEEDSYHYQVIRDGVKYYWPMEETSGTSIFSITGFGKEGQFTNTPTLQSAAIFSTLNNSIHFNGSDERINLFSWEALTSATYSIAVRASSISSEQRFLALNNQSPYILMRYVNASTLGFTMNNTGAVNLVASAVNPTDPILITGSFKLSGMNYLYVNGALVDSASAPTTGTQPTTLENRIGCSRSNSLFFNGYIDDLAIRNQQISETQVRSQWAALQGYASGTYQHAVIMDGATAYWPLTDDNGASDVFKIVGHHSGTYIGTVSAAASGITRHHDRSVKFGAVASSGVKITDRDLFDKTGNHSFELWYRTTASATDHEALFAKESAGVNYPEWQVRSKSNGHVMYALSSANSIGGRHTCSTTAAYDDNWEHHVVCRHDNTANTMQIFVDGVQDASATFNGNVYNSSDDITIGYNKGTIGTRPFDGYISDVAVYATALSDATIAAHYNRGRPLQINDQSQATYASTVKRRGAQAYYRFAETSVGSGFDSFVGSPQTFTVVRGSTTVSATVSGLVTGDSTTGGIRFKNTAVQSNTVALLHNSSFAPSGTAIRSFETWFNVSDTSFNRHGVGLWITTSNYCALKCRDGTTSKMVLFSGTGAGDILTTAGNISASTTHHAVVTYDGSVTSMYLDGVLADSSTVNPGGMDGAAATEATIGGFKDSGSVLKGSMSGVLDEVAFYTSVLSPATILDHYQKGSA